MKPRVPRRRRSVRGGRPWLRVGAFAHGLAWLLVLLGGCGVAPWAGFGSQWGGVGSLGVIGAASSLIVLLGIVLRLQWRPLSALAGLLVLLGSLVLVAVFPPRPLLWWLNDPEGPVFLFETDKPLVALTIDDGVDSASTPVILDVLAEHQARATFFVLSETLSANRPLVERLLAEGHELANHQTRDVPTVSLEAAEAADEILRADAALREFGEPRWYRPGGGIATDAAIKVARRRGCTCVLGSVFPFDSHVPLVAFLAAYVAERPTPGDIIVLHDGAGRGARTAEVLRRALPRLAERGLRCVTLSGLERAL